MSILINGSFLTQRITGQQRYATELSRILLQRSDVTLAEPEGYWERQALATWTWCQGPALYPPNGSVTLSLTSRAPLIGRRQVIAVHDTFVLTNPEWYSRGYATTHALALRMQLATAKGIVCVSPQTLEAVDVLAPHTPKALVPNGVRVPDREVTAEDRKVTAEEDQPISRRKPYLLCVSSIDPRKNVAALINAYELLPPEIRQSVDLVLVGGHSPGVFADGAGEPQRRPGVHWTGYVSEAELDNWYREAVALVMPSLAEGFGLPVIEAAARGVPVVVSDIPVFRWICGDDAHYVDPLDRHSIAQGLAAAVGTDRRPEEALGTADAIQSRFSWQRSADLLYGFVQEIL